MKIAGAGWVNSRAYGTAIGGLKKDFAGGLRQALKADGILTERIQNAGKFDEATTRLFCAAALALHDAGFSPSISLRAGNHWKHVALIGTGSEECTEANRVYFADYVQNGRKLARANLFIYTLPTSPLAEIAIHFKLDGPLFYTSGNIIAAAKRLLNSGESSHVLGLFSAEDLAIAILLDSKNGGDVETAQALENLLASTRVHSR